MLSMIANDNINTDVLIGQCYIPLRDVIENNGGETNFEVAISLFGKIFGTFVGSMTYDIEHSEVFLT